MSNKALGRKSTAASRRRACDRLWSLLVRQRDHYTCRLLSAQCAGSVQAAHIIPRTPPYSTRWILDNGVALCIFHHAQFDQHRVDRQALILEWLGPAKWEWLLEMRRGTWDRDYARVLAELKALDREMRLDPFGAQDADT